MFLVIPEGSISWAEYHNYPEFQKRFQALTEAYGQKIDQALAHAHTIIGTAPSGSQAFKAWEEGYDVLEQEYRQAIIDLHEELQVPYLVDLQSALQATNHACYHDERDVYPEHIHATTHVSVRAADEDTNQFVIEIHEHILVPRDDLEMYGLHGCLSNYSGSTWEAVPPSDYWKAVVQDCQRKMDEGSSNGQLKRPNASRKSEPLCWIDRTPDGRFDLLFADKTEASGLREHEVNMLLKQRGIPLGGWK